MPDINLSDFLTMQVGLARTTKRGLLCSLADRWPERYDASKHQRVYAWFNGGGISLESAADVADVLGMDVRDREMFAEVAGYSHAVELLRGRA